MNLRPKEAAARLGVHRETLRRWREQGRIRSLKVSKKLHLYPLEALEEFERQAAEASEKERGA